MAPDPFSRPAEQGGFQVCAVFGRPDGRRGGNAGKKRAAATLRFLEMQYDPECEALWPPLSCASEGRL